MAVTCGGNESCGCGHCQTLLSSTFGKYLATNSRLLPLYVTFMRFFFHHHLFISYQPKHQVGLVLVATSSPDDLFGDAPSVATAIGASSAVAFDVTAACR